MASEENGEIFFMAIQQLPRSRVEIRPPLPPRRKAVAISSSGRRRRSESERNGREPIEQFRGREVGIGRRRSRRRRGHSFEDVSLVARHNIHCHLATPGRDFVVGETDRQQRQIRDGSAKRVGQRASARRRHGQTLEGNDVLGKI